MNYHKFSISSTFSDFLPYSSLCTLRLWLVSEVLIIVTNHSTKTSSFPGAQSAKNFACVSEGKMSLWLDTLSYKVFYHCCIVLCVCVCSCARMSEDNFWESIFAFIILCGWCPVIWFVQQAFLPTEPSHQPWLGISDHRLWLSLLFWNKGI